ncbi:MAG TPA: ATP-grasp domain-containing protein [Candidatus Nanoarchaeia archaeon]|nr:ATP-grasp domain-containing protein [Candidatus Nanoarchaeia archaeon]
MKLLEVEGKALFKQSKIPIPKGILINSIKEINKIKTPCILKAQILSGKRGKAGLIKKFSKEEIAQAKAFAKQLFKNKEVFSVLSEQLIPIQKEYYLSLMIDGTIKDVICIFSKQGGMDIEEVSKQHPKEIIKFKITKTEISKHLKLPTAEKQQITKLIFQLHKLMQQYDAELVELNPLAITKNGIVAVDSKVVIDTKALYRHPEFQPFEHRELTGRELEAAHLGLHYVDLDGNIGVIGDGAGLVMATLDVLAHYKLKPANFLDVGGGAGEERMINALKIITQKKLKCIFVNIFGGITLCDDIARALVAAKEKLNVKIPFVVRMAGTNVKEAEIILNKANIKTVPTMLDGIKKVRTICH